MQCLNQPYYYTWGLSSGEKLEKYFTLGLEFCLCYIHKCIFWYSNDIAHSFLPSNSLKTLESFSESWTALQKKAICRKLSTFPSWIFVWFLLTIFQRPFWNLICSYKYSFFTHALVNTLSKTRYLDKSLQIYAKQPPILRVTTNNWSLSNFLAIFALYL